MDRLLDIIIPDMMFCLQQKVNESDNPNDKINTI